MRTRQQIEQARCIVGSFVQGLPPLEFTAEERMALCRLQDALCWVMGVECPHAANFQTILDGLQKKAAAAGWKMDDIPAPSPDPSRN